MCVRPDCLSFEVTDGNGVALVDSGGFVFRWNLFIEAVLQLLQPVGPGWFPSSQTSRSRNGG